MNDAYGMRFDKVCAEVERLRKISALLASERTDLLADNVKLRELVRDLYEMAYPECPSAFEAAFADRMRELGIEAD